MFKALGLKPDAVAGHSYGELSALHASGVFNTEDFVAVSRKRGELMRDAAVLPGAMSAVKAPREKIQPVLDSSGLPVVIANHNSPRQSVISRPKRCRGTSGSPAQRSWNAVATLECGDRLPFVSGQRLCCALPEFP